NARELAGEQFGDVDADVADRQSGQNPRQSTALAGLDAVEQVLGRLLAHALQVGELSEAEAVNVRERGHQARFHPLVHDGIPQALDIHGVAVSEEAELFLELGGAQGVDTAVIDAALIALDGTATHWALRWKLERLFTPGAGAGLRAD